MNMSFVIGIAGPSAGGKTTVSSEIVKKVKEHGNNITIIGHDNYYRDQSHMSMEERVKTNYDHPHAFETDLLIEHLETLRNGGTVTMPTYDYTNHTRSEKTETIKNNDVIIVEGILTLENKDLRRLFDLRIYVDTDADECLIRRITRDTQERGRDLDSVLTQYRDTVKPMLIQFIEPSKRHANIIVPANKDIRKAIDLISNHLNNII
ncbi:uridine kinase [Mollicutes bacterium LVI A0039]|nr:uridine kinase [Mollicutes bacterium LVI A0039]